MSILFSPLPGDRQTRLWTHLRTCLRPLSAADSGSSRRTAARAGWARGPGSGRGGCVRSSGGGTGNATGLAELASLLMSSTWMGPAWLFRLIWYFFCPFRPWDKWTDGGHVSTTTPLPGTARVHAPRRGPGVERGAGGAEPRVPNTARQRPPVRSPQAPPVSTGAARVGAGHGPRAALNGSCFAGQHSFSSRHARGPDAPAPRPTLRGSLGQGVDGSRNRPHSLLCQISLF